MSIRTLNTRQKFYSEAGVTNAAGEQTVLSGTKLFGNAKRFVISGYSDRTCTITYRQIRPASNWHAESTLSFGPGSGDVVFVDNCGQELEVVVTNNDAGNAAAIEVTITVEE